MDSIAIVGYSFKFPGGCEDDSSFWDMLKKGKNVMSQWPESRANVDAFYDADGTRKNTVGNHPFVPNLHIPTQRHCLHGVNDT